MHRVLFVATVVKTHIMEFHLPWLRLFKEQGWETAVAARNDYEDPKDCVIPFCDSYYNLPFERNPLKPGNPAAYRQLKRLIDSGHYDIIHCHTPVGAALTRLAARRARAQGTRVIYTAHGFHFYRGAPLLNWLTYYPAERFLARYTDTLITINTEDYRAAQRFRAGEVRYVHGVGVDTERFGAFRDRAGKRAELGLGETDFVLLSVGELNKNKNHAAVLRALGELKRRGSLGNIRYLICGRGPLQQELTALAAELGIGDRVQLSGYRNDVSEICAAADLFVFMSHREGLSVALMEAMSCGLPVICSKIRGNTDLITDGVSGRLCGDAPAALAEAIAALRDDPALRERFSEAAKKAVSAYDLGAVSREMRSIYFGI